MIPKSSRSSSATFPKTIHTISWLSLLTFLWLTSSYLALAQTVSVTTTGNLRQPQEESSSNSNSAVGVDNNLPPITSNTENLQPPEDESSSNVAAGVDQPAITPVTTTANLQQQSSTSTTGTTSTTTTSTNSNANTKTYDCKEGCSLNPSLMGPPVCGKDGLTYSNRCVAQCQKVAIAGDFSCDGSVSAEQEGVDSAAVITAEIMQRFADEDFKFVAKLNPSKFASPSDMKQYENVPDDLPQTESASGIPDTLTFVRVTREGHQYMAKVKASELARASATQAHPGPMPEKLNLRYLQRAMAIIGGSDERVLVSDTQSFPYRAIGEAGFGGGEGGCTVTMISRDAAVTAGHCIWENGKYLNLDNVGFGRYRASGASKSPFGSWLVDTRTTTQEYMSSAQRRFDVAVITFKPATRDGCQYMYPGDVVGYLGIDRSARSGSTLDSRLASSAIIAGYPYDKADGEMWKSGPCQWQAPDYTQYGFHWCDTMPGNSGSAVIVTGNVVIGDHAYGHGSSYNGAILWEGTLFDVVYGWGGFDKDLPKCGTTTPPKSCPCTTITNAWLKIACSIIFFNRCFQQPAGKS